MRLIVPALLLALAAVPASAGSTLPFISDDWSKALAQARSRNVPLFVEAWAPWCHTCRSMREFVLTDPSLAPRASEFVWLEINTEDARNSDFLERFPIDALPTFAVHEVKEGTPAVRYVGSMSVPQLQAFLDRGRDAARGHAPDAAGPALAEADRLYGAAKYAEAAAAYRAALDKAPAGWKDFGRATESLQYALVKTSAHADVVAVAEAALPRVAGTTSELAIAAAGLDAALHLPADSPKRADRVAALEERLGRLVAAPPAGVAADDVSGAYITLLSAREDAKDEAGGKAVAQRWATYLDGAAARATSPRQRTVFDSHRLSAYREIGRPELAVPMLEQSAKDFPDDYNPPARLAVAYLAMKEYDKALAASDRALGLGYGPRKLGMYDVRAEIYKAKGDLAGARRALEQALAEAEKLPKGQKPERAVAMVKKKLAALDKPAS
jgi:thioredoxin-like negative regulator of GroEL